MRNILLHFRMFMSRCYFGCLDYPVLILTFIFVLSLVAVFFPRQFTFDASEDTLVAEGDPALEYYREISGKFTSQEYLFLSSTCLARISGLVLGRYPCVFYLVQFNEGNKTELNRTVMVINYSIYCVQHGPGKGRLQQRVAGL